MQNNDTELESQNDATKSNEAYVSVLRASAFSGPIPPPQTLEKYEKILPGSADRILKMAESQLEHDQKIQASVLATESRDSFLGIISALIIAIVIVACGTSMVIIVKGATGAICGSVLNLAGVGTIIGTFLNGTSKSRKSQNGKSD